MYNRANQAVAFCGVEGLLDYFHMENQLIPKDVTTLEAAVNYLNEETGLILVPTSLEGDWYRTCAGPILAQDQDGMDVAILPDWRGRYYFRDAGSGQRVYITGQNCPVFPTAYSVTMDFPGKAVSGPGLIGRMLREISWYEGGLLLLWGLLGGILWMLLAERVHSLLASVILTADQVAFWSAAGAILLICLLEMLLVLSGRQVLCRVAQKGSLAALVGIGRRLYAAGGLHEAEGTAAGLAALRSSGERVMQWMLTALWGFLCVLVSLLALLDRSPEGFASAGGIAVILYLGAALVFLAVSRQKVDGRTEQRQREWLSHQASDRKLGIQRPFPDGWGGRRQPEYLLGAAWPATALLGLPMVYFMIAGGHSAARLVQTMLLYLPAVALPLGALLGAVPAGRTMAGMRSLPPFAEKQPTGTVALPPMGSVFELKDVTFSYPDHLEPVLRRVNLRLYPGEVVGILGDTGSGKTTLERLMTGLVRPTSGDIYYGGVEIARYNGSALRRRVAYERGEDVLLCREVPGQRDGRTCVVFSAREDGLTGCDRIMRLVDGELIQEQQ